MGGGVGGSGIRSWELGFGDFGSRVLGSGSSRVFASSLGLKNPKPNPQTLNAQTLAPTS